MAPNSLAALAVASNQSTSNNRSQLMSQLYFLRRLVNGSSRSAAISLAFVLSCTAPSCAQAQSALSREAAQEIIAPFYKALVSSSPEEIDHTLTQVTAPDWQNCATNDTCEALPDVLKRWMARISVVPNMRWEQKELLVSGDTIIVRGQNTGTPAAPFLGIAPNGRFFSIMTIDIHEIRTGKIARTYHLENWSRAIQQLSAAR
jgi:predicted ester cyclase